MGWGLPNWILRGFPTRFLHGSYTVPVGSALSPGTGWWGDRSKMAPELGIAVKICKISCGIARDGLVGKCWPQNEESLQNIMFLNIPDSREALHMLAPESGIAPMYCATQYSSSRRDSADIGSRIRNRSKALCLTVFQLPETVCGCWLHNQETFKSVVFHSIPAFREGLRMLAP